MVQHGLVVGIAKNNVAELDEAFDAAQAAGAARVLVLGRFVEHLAGALQSGERLGELGADTDHLEERRGQVSKEDDVAEIGAQGKLAGHDFARADEHDHRSHYAHQGGRRRRHQRGRGEGAEDVLQQPLNAGGEDLVLAGLGVIALDHPHAAKRFGEPAGDLGIDAAALAKDRADDLE